MKKLISLLTLILFLPSVVFAPVWPIKTRASQVRTKTSNFDNILSSTTTTTQKALDILDNVLISSTTADNNYVNITGDTMTGDLTLHQIIVSTVTFSAGEIFVDSDDLHIRNVKSDKDIIFTVNSGGVIAIPLTLKGTARSIQGYNCIASGGFSVALGKESEATGLTAVAIGETSKATGDGSVAIGELAEASSIYSIALGWGQATGEAAIAIGGSNASPIASGLASIAIGDNITAGTADYTIAIGKDFTNNTTNSFMVGFGDETFRVEDDTVTVSGNLDVEGTAEFVDVTLSTITFSDGTILTSTSTCADNLGNHIATQDIDAFAYNLSITTITFSDFTILTSTSGLGGGGWDGQSDLAIANGVKLTGGYLRIGNAGAVSYVDGDGDLYVEDELEVAGNTHLGDSVSDNIYCYGKSWLKYETNVGNDKSIAFGLYEYAKISWETLGDEFLGIQLTGGSRNMIISDWTNTNFGHPTTAYNPRLYIQSSDQASPSDHISFWHDQTDGNIEVGAGDLILTIAGDDLLPSTTNHNLGSSSNYWGTLHISSITYHSIPDYQPDLSISEDILRIQPSDKSSYPSSIYREPVDTIKIKKFEKDKIPKSKEKIKYKKIKDLPIECIVKKYDVELEDFIEDIMLLEDVTDEEIIEILPQKSEVEVTYVGNEGLSLEAIISLLIEHNKELEQRVRELESK